MEVQVLPEGTAPHCSCHRKQGDLITSRGPPRRLDGGQFAHSSPAVRRARGSQAAWDVARASTQRIYPSRWFVARYPWCRRTAFSTRYSQVTQQYMCARARPGAITHDRTLSRPRHQYLCHPLSAGVVCCWAAVAGSHRTHTQRQERSIPPPGGDVAVHSDLRHHG
jgi:hypothetical protein